MGADVKKGRKMEEVEKKQEVRPSKYQGKQYAIFSVKNKRGYEISRFAARFSKREGFYYCYSSRRLSSAKDKIFCRRPTWADVAAGAVYLLNRMKAGQWEEFGKLRDYSIQRDQEVDLRFSPVLVGKTSRVLLPVTIEDTGEIMEDNFHLSYSTAMKILLVLMKTKQDGATCPDTAKVEVLKGID
jgi:hypothetical protein